MSDKKQNKNEEITNEEIKEKEDSREDTAKAGPADKKDGKRKRPKETDEELNRLTGTALENRIFQAIDLGEVEVFRKLYPRHEPDKYWDSKIDIVVHETGGSYEKLPTGIRVYLLPIHIGYLCQSPNPELEELEETLRAEMKKTIPDKERTVFLEETLRRMIALDDRYLRDKLKCIVRLYDSLDHLVDNHYVEKWQDRICSAVCDHLKGNQKLLDKAVQYSGTDDYPEHLAAELKIAAGHEDPEEFETQDVTTSKRWIATAVVGILVVVLAIWYVAVMHGNRGGGSDVVTVENGAGQSAGGAAGTEGSAAAGGTQETSSEPAGTETQETSQQAQTADTAQNASSAVTADTAGEAGSANTADTSSTQTTETTEQQEQVDMSDVPAEGSTMSITQTYTVYSEMSEDDSKSTGEVINGYSVIVDKVYDTGWIQITYYTGSPLTQHQGYIKYK